MKYVDLDQLEAALNQDWQDRSMAALDEARACDPRTRSKAITARAGLWREAGKAAAAMTGERCWYCDLHQVRSDMPVDHFRPKGRVAEDKAHPGYWWLAFTWSNFRYACTFCNSRRVDVESGSEGGKQDHFPLLGESPRACCEDDDLSLEVPALLDPAAPQDPPLLTFWQDGKCVSRYDEATDSVAAERVRLSVHLYHLDHPSLVSARRRIWRKIDQLVDRGEKHRLEGRSLDEVKSDLHELMRPTSPLHRVARLAIRGRRDIGWVLDWLEEVETTL